MNVTRTYGPLHFNDLSPDRFEDLCFAIIYRLQYWTDIHPYGAKGADGGIDIYGEFSEEGITNRWVVQCKRYQKLSTSEVKKIINDYKSNNDLIPDCYILMVSCDPSRKTIEAFKEHSRKAGIEQALIYPAKRLEADLYRYDDLIKIYFGISMNRKRATIVNRIKHRLIIKKKMISTFKVSNDYPHPRVIIRDIHRDIYPDHDISSMGISSWWPLEYYGLYFKGVSFLRDIVTVFYYPKTREWRIANYKEILPEGWLKISAFSIANIPYDNIIDVDMIGDEYYSEPHFYCEFNNLGGPYEEIWYTPDPKYKEDFIRQGLLIELEKEKQIHSSNKKPKTD